MCPYNSVWYSNGKELTENEAFGSRLYYRTVGLCKVDSSLKAEAFFFAVLAPGNNESSRNPVPVISFVISVWTLAN